MSFAELWSALLPIGRDAGTGGYRRFAWTREDHTLREWFAGECATRGLDLVEDRMGNQWAWWGDPDAHGAGVVTGSHLDSVPDGGAYDGPLGVISALAAVDRLRAAGVPAGPADRDRELRRRGRRPVRGRLRRIPGDHRRPAGRPRPRSARQRRGVDGRGHDRGRPPPGRTWASTRKPSAGSGSSWNCTSSRAAAWSTRTSRWASAPASGRTAGGGSTSPVRPTMPAPPGWRTATTPCSAMPRPCSPPGTRPTGTAAWPPWARSGSVPAGSTPSPARCPAGWTPAAPTSPRSGRPSPTSRRVRPGPAPPWSRSPGRPATAFSPTTVARLQQVLPDAPLLTTGAGHDAGILAAERIPAAMLFVRNPTGVSHSPAEWASEADCLAGVEALADGARRPVERAER